MHQACTNCGQRFEISSQDLEYYKKASPIVGGVTLDIPPPTHCPDCRQQRRFAWRNERSLFHRKCDKTGKAIISFHAPGNDVVVYDKDEWFGDGWDAKEYGKDFDFSRPFFEQYAELQRVVPQLGMQIWNSENCDFCSYVGDCKDCYLVYGSVYSQNCYFGSPYYSLDCMDTLVLRNCERCYECIDCRKLHTCFYCQDCHSSNDLIYCYDLLGCKDCIACAGLRQKQYCIFNKQYSKEEYVKMKAQLDLSKPHIHEKLRSELKKFCLSIPHRFMQSNIVENVSGNYIYECKNAHNCFYADKSEDIKHCAQVVDLKDCYDNNYTEENELCVEYFGAYQNNRTSFSKLCNLVNDALYCDACHSSKNLFGCTGIRNSQYCILNKQYSKEEYEALVPKIVDHMCKTGEWGEFFPISISPLGYNETVAQEYFPMERAAIEAKRWKWYEEEKNTESYMGPIVEVPNSIDDVDASFCKKILQCKTSGKLFRIIEQELKLYKELHLPIPSICPNIRHLDRLAMRNPRRLWERTCNKCEKPIQTSYAPERPEIVYCESCYLNEVY